MLMLGMFEENQHLIILALNLEGAVGRRNILLDGDRAHHDIFLTRGGTHEHRRNRLIESGQKTGFGHLLLVG